MDFFEIQNGVLTDESGEIMAKMWRESLLCMEDVWYTVTDMNLKD